VTQNSPFSANDAAKTVVRPDSMPEVDSRELMRGAREIAIRHGNEWYRLSVTRAGKLILRK
jgi:hemin uptake protein HemP